MDSPIIQAFIRSALIPAVLVTLAVFASGYLPTVWRARLQALSLALGFMFGAYRLLDRFNIPPHDVSESFGWAALLLAVFVLISPKPTGSRYLIRALFVLAAGAIVLWPIQNLLNHAVAQRNLIAFFCLGLGVWSILARRSGTVRTTTLILLPLISATAVSLLLLYSSSASFSQLVTVLCAILGGLMVLSLIKPKLLSHDAVVPFLSVFIILFMAAGHFALDVNPWRMIYLSFPFLLLWVRSFFKFIPSHPILEPLVFGLVAAVPLAYLTYQTALASGPLY